MVWPSSTLRVVMKLNIRGKRSEGRPRLRWLDNIDSHLKGKKTSLKEVFGTKCFKNRQDWRRFISRSTDRSSGYTNMSHYSLGSRPDLRQLRVLVTFHPSLSPDRCVTLLGELKSQTGVVVTTELVTRDTQQDDVVWLVILHDARKVSVDKTKLGISFNSVDRQ